MILFRRLFVLCLVILGGAGTGCSLNSAKKQYVLAEKLWTDGKYSAAVTEFDKVYARDPHSKLARQALLRSAMTQAYFLSQYGDAVRKFKLYADLAEDKASAWEALTHVGEILFSKMELYEQAIPHYLGLLKRRPDDPDAAMFLFRVGKSHFHLWQFADAVRVYTEVARAYPKTVWAERADFEIGVTHFTRSEQHSESRGESARSLSPLPVQGSESCQDAIDSYQRFIKKYPKSELLPQAQFGIASCLEEMDQLDAAYHAYQALRSTYPSPKVITIKLVRIRERKTQRNR